MGKDRPYREWPKERQLKSNGYKEAYRRRQRSKLLGLLGDACAVCGEKDRVLNVMRGTKGWLQFHEKLGTPHHPSFGVVLKNVERFVPLCPRCHRGVHFCLHFLGMSWEELSENLMAE